MGFHLACLQRQRRPLGPGPGSSDTYKWVLFLHVFEAEQDHLAQKRGRRCRPGATQHSALRPTRLSRPQRRSAPLGTARQHLERVRKLPTKGRGDRGGPCFGRPDARSHPANNPRLARGIICRFGSARDLLQSCTQNPRSQGLLTNLADLAGCVAWLCSCPAGFCHGFHPQPRCLASPS